MTESEFPFLRDAVDIIIDRHHGEEPDFRLAVAVIMSFAQYHIEQWDKEVRPTYVPTQSDKETPND